MRRSTHRVPMLFTLAALTLALSGCALFESRAAETDAQREAAMLAQMRTARLIQALDEFEDYFTGVVADAAVRIRSQATSQQVRRDAARWKLRLTSLCEEAIGQPDPAAALIDTWALCVRMRDALKEGEASDLFGAAQPLAITAAERLTDRIQTIGCEFLPTEEKDQCIATINEYARQNPMDRSFSRPKQEPLSDSKKDNALVSWLMTPLAPLQTFGKINRSADAIANMRPVAERFTEVVSELPEKSRWQLELLLMSLEELEFIRSAIEDFGAVAETASRFTDVVDQLPERLRAQSEQLLAAADARQDNLQTTLDKAQEVSSTVERTVDASTRLADALESTAAEVRLTVNAIADLRRTDESTPGKTTGEVSKAEQFDVQHYTAAAETFGQTTAQVRGLVGDLRTLLESGTLTGNLDTVKAEATDTVDLTVARLADLSDHIAWRLGQLFLLVFALALVYRVATSRIRPRPAGGN